MKTLKRKIVRLTALSVYLAAVLLSALFVAAPTASAAENAFIRFLHASPKLSNVDIFIDGKAFHENFAFASISDNYEYKTYTPGKHSVQIAPAGKGTDAAVIKKDIEIKANAAYTLAAIGNDDASLELLSFEDDNSIMQPGAAKARFYHLCADCGTLDITLTDIQQGVNDVNYKSASDYLYMPGGKYTINGTLATGQQVPFEITIDANYVSSAFAVGLVAGEPKLQLVGSRVSALPGLPNTGSEPAQIQSAPWLLIASIAGAVALCATGAGAAFWLRRSRQVA